MNAQSEQQAFPAPDSTPADPLIPEQPALIVVTEIMAAGKSTVARLLARRFARGVHIEADVLQHMLVSGGQWPGEPSECGGFYVKRGRLIVG